MGVITRRTLLSSIASSIVFASNAANAFVCDVQRARRDNLSTKSYNCVIGEGKSLTATFIRMSDVVADTIGGQGLPGEFETLIRRPQLLDTPALGVLQDLLAQFSTPFQPPSISIEFDGRNDEGTPTWQTQSNSARFRSLGVWDDGNYGELRAFPLLSELRRAFRLPQDELKLGFLRFATSDDFLGLASKTNDYLQFWRETDGNALEDVLPDGFGNIDLMAHIEAGSVPGFLPLFFSGMIDGCAGQFGGPQYAVPALYIDAMVCENTGTEPIDIDDFFGVDDSTQSLRRYSPTTPPGEQVLGWGSASLEPGQSVAGLQRLLFGAHDQYDYQNDRMLTFDRAVYGPMQLPKGVIIQGEGFAFDGRSHNALIVASFYEEGCCPYLSYWCDIAEEWVSIGKVIVGRTSAELEGEEDYEFEGLRTRFKLTEREYERTFIRSLTLEIELEDGTTIQLGKPDFSGDNLIASPIILEIGQALSFSFHLSEDIEKDAIARTKLSIRGFYEGYTIDDFDQRRAIAVPV